MTKAEEYFIELTNEIPDVKPGKMFGALCMKTTNGKAAAMFWKDNIVVKLQGDALSEACKIPGTAFFEPMQGRPMKEWLMIPFVQKNQWRKYTLISVDIAANTPYKTKKK